MTVASPVSSRSMTNIWDEVLARIEAKINRHSFYTWFKPTSFVADQGGTIHVRVPNALFRDWLTKHYSTVINEVARPNSTGRPPVVLFLTEGEEVSIGPGAARDPIEDRAGRGPMSRPDDESRFRCPSPAPSGLNPRYTFDTFIVGPSNQFAHAAVAGRRGSPLAVL